MKHRLEQSNRFHPNFRTLLTLCVFTLAFHSTSTTLAGATSTLQAGALQPITVSNADQIKEVLTIRDQSAADSSQSFAVAFSPDGKMLLTTGADDSLQLWDVSSGQAIAQPIAGSSPAAFSPDGQTIAFFDASSSSSVHLWNIATAHDVRPPLTGGVADVTSLAFSPDGKTLAMGSADDLVRLWDVTSGTALHEMHQSRDANALQDLVGSISSVAFSPDGKTLATTLCEDIVDTDCRQGDVQIWDVVTGKMIGESLSGHTDWVASVTFSPDGKLLASGSWDSTIRLWDAASHVDIGILQSHTDSVIGLAFSPDSKILVSGSWDNTVKLWDVGNDKLLTTLTGHSDSVIGVAFSSDGKLIASAGQDGTVRLWGVRGQ
ncbi:MAG TPA: WD40 repeat domain-containing protein [Aggregatilineales bacterium]|nr:WD40 repeat domain-containing protein [Aggregatilineales bacterium]